MSHITDIARAEAEEAEAENPDAELEEAEHEEGGQSPEPEPEPAAGLPSFDPDKLEREQKRHGKALEAVFGASWADFNVCEGCGGIGHVPRGLEPPAELVEDPGTVRCEACNGYGVLVTGSRHEQYVVHTCQTCTGRGFQDRDALEASRRAREYAAAPAYVPPPPPPTWDPTRGAWIDQFGNPVGPVQPPAQPY